MTTGTSDSQTTTHDRDSIANFLHAGQTISSEHTSATYVIVSVEPIGLGGFGHPILAKRYADPDADPELVCLKFLRDQDSWHREAYFSTLVRGNSRVVQCLDDFPFPILYGRERHLFYVLVFEFMSNGSVDNCLKGGRPWMERRVRREVLALLSALNEIHGGGGVHRDLTPMNILVAANGALKLADFGVAGHTRAGGAAIARKYNRWFVPQALKNRQWTRWSMAEDIYQMGQLMGMMLRGESRPLTARQISTLTCSQELREIILKATSARESRYQDAFEMMEALNGRGANPRQTVRSLRGKRVVFSGPMSMPRSDAVLYLIQAGGKPQAAVHANTDVIVVGRRSRHYKKGAKGTKYLAADRLARGGRRIPMITELQFRRLVALAPL